MPAETKLKTVIASRDDCERDVAAAFADHSQTKWACADALAVLADCGATTAEIQRTVDEAGADLSMRQIQRLVQISRLFPAVGEAATVRNAGVAFWGHYEMRKLPDAERAKLLGLAAYGQWTVHQIRRSVIERMPTVRADKKIQELESKLRAMQNENQILKFEKKRALRAAGKNVINSIRDFERVMNSLCAPEVRENIHGNSMIAIDREAHQWREKVVAECRDTLFPCVQRLSDTLNSSRGIHGESYQTCPL